MHNHDLSGQVAIITGASSGIGHATAKALAGAVDGGMTLYPCFRGGG